MRLSAKTASLIQSLTKHKMIPSNIEFSSLGDLHIVAGFLDRPNAVISEDVVTGVAFDIEEALNKCLSEYVERIVAADWLELNPQYATEGSLGFAAYPRSSENAEMMARTAAFAEALERFVWAAWWDDPEIGADIQKLRTEGSLADLHSQLPLKDIYQIRPVLANSDCYAEILFAQVESSGGFVSGGAAGKVGSARVRDAAVAELCRHGLAYKRMQSGRRNLVTSYEKRLWHFASGDGSSAVFRRLERCGGGRLVLPNLEVDTPVKHFLSELYVVHKCHFHFQPAFLGGALERLCL